MVVIDWQRIGETVVTTTVPIILIMWSNRRRAKRDMDARHAENQKKLDDLAKEREYFPVHIHTEREGNLTVKGLHPPRE